MRNIFTKLLTSLLLASMFFSSVAHAGFEKKANVAGVNLRLNGFGTRYKFVIKVYDLALYTAKPVNTAADLLRLDGPVKLQFIALRELSSTDLGLSLIKGMEANSSELMSLKHVDHIRHITKIFSGRQKIKKDQTFGIEFTPGNGAQFLIDDVPQGAPVGDDEYFRMVLGVWFGKNPADFRLRDQLLGITRAAD